MSSMLRSAPKNRGWPIDPTFIADGETTHRNDSRFPLSLTRPAHCVGLIQIPHPTLQGHLLVGSLLT